MVSVCIHFSIEIFIVFSVGVSVCTPDVQQSSGIRDKMGGVPEREHYFWVYTDFYKWSLLSQAGKLALLVNVFADPSFSRRNEYIFRNKEAVRLATSIEYFIEKFMSVMHLRLETSEGAFDAPIAAPTKQPQVGMHDSGAWNEDEVREDEVDMDLLNLDDDMSRESNSRPVSTAAPFGFGVTTEPSKSKAHDDPFASDPFGSDFGSSPAAKAPSAPPQPANIFSDDPFADDFGSSAPSKVVATPAATATIDLFSDDFGSSAVPVVTVPPAPPANQVVDLFGGDDIFGVGTVATAAPVEQPKVKLAPPLTPQQRSQHALWLLQAQILTQGKLGGPIYDDGALQIAASVEIRGSQGRVTFNLRNNSPSSLNEVRLGIVDSVGLLRYELSAGPANGVIIAFGQATQTLMIECMKPAFPGPQLTVEYNNQLVGKRSESISLPVSVLSFCEHLALSGNDFMTRWESLGGPGLQAQEIFGPSRPIVPSEVAASLTSVCNISSAICFDRIR
jgi:hypothetical protein